MSRRAKARSDSRRRIAIVAAVRFATAAVTLVAAGVQHGCLERRAAEDRAEDEQAARCATCHGDPDRPGDHLRKAAPPRDLLGVDDPSYPGVGAHEVHLESSETHEAIACDECHRIPQDTTSEGHADDAYPAEVVFGPFARRDGLEPRYDFAAQRCSDTYCHGDANAVWTRPRSAQQACGSCHGLPPPRPHPQSEACGVCHGEVADDTLGIVNPALHVDGTVQVEVSGCTGCHGSGDEPAPPVDTEGNSEVSAIGVGAHTAHLTGGGFSRPLGCAECHTVPDPNAPDPLEHVDGVPAEVALTGVARSNGRAPTWDRATRTCANTHCHGPTPGTSRASPSWVEPADLVCTSCHGAPPGLPHPQVSDCSSCHGAVVGADDVSIVDRMRHVDGTVDVEVGDDCTACHGGTTPAPPVALDGSSSTLSPGVGAHAVHVTGTSRARAVRCVECHRVPDTVLAAGHVDTSLPAEVTFSGVARSFGAAPAYANGSCSGTPCHGARFRAGHPSGGSDTEPSWTAVTGTGAACGSCHALPPPDPHPPRTRCSVCHLNISADDVTFTRPELHVDGAITFVVP